MRERLGGSAPRGRQPALICLEQIHKGLYLEQTPPYKQLVGQTDTPDMQFNQRITQYIQGGPYAQSNDSSTTHSTA